MVALLALLAAALIALPVLAELSVTGVEGDVLTNVREYASNAPPCDAAARTVRRYAANLPETLAPALEAYGYYSARIDATREPRQSDCWRIDVAITPGPTVNVERVQLEIEGDAEQDAAIAALVAAFPLHVGDPLHHEDYRAFKGRLEALARERGYLDGRFTVARVDVYVDRRAADLALTFDSGPRFAFGAVTFNTDALAQTVLRSFVPFAEGQPYDAALVAQLQRDLSGSGYFARASVAPQPDQAHDREIPIRVDATPAQPVSYSVGGGFSTDDGPRFSFDYDNVRRNAKGHQMSGSLLLSAVRQTATFDYRVPAGNPQRDWRTFRAGIAREDIDAGVGSAARVGVRRTRARNAFTATRFVDALFEQDEIAGVSLGTQLLIPGVTWTRTERDRLVRPRSGHRLSAELSLGLGDLALLQADLRAKWIGALPWGARVLVRGRLGTTAENEDFSHVPLSMRFFAGGDNSVRGYDYESLGPRAPDGELIGGDRLLEASIEYEHPILENWAVATFVDAGNAFRGSSVDARRGAGFGGRWFSPIGPVRFDVAWPLNPADGDRSPRLHISLGPDL